MEKFADQIQEMFYAKVLLFKELKKILEQEKNHIVEMNLEALWKTTDRKKQIAVEITQIKDQLRRLFEENKSCPEKGDKNFSISHAINGLALGERSKSDLNQTCTELKILKQELAGLASANKRYTSEYLSVIHGIFATITGTENREKYTSAGRILKDKDQKYFIRAEV